MAKINSIFSKCKHKTILLLAYLLCALFDFVALLSLLIGGTLGEPLVAVIVVCCMTALFGVLIWFTNPKQKYSILYYLAYAGANIAVLIYAFTYTATPALFTTSAYIIFLCARILSLVFFVYAAIRCVLANSEDYAFKTKSSFAVTAIFTLLIFSSIVMTGIFGLFGQGYTYTPLVYRLDEATDTYYVTGMVESTRKVIKIPETFNGKKVSAYSAYLFKKENLKKVIIENTEEKLTLNVPNILYYFKDSTDNVQMVVDKSLMDEYREEFYTMSLAEYDQDAKEHLISLANLMTPSGVKNDEVYVSFAYDRETLELCENKTLKTWFGKKGDTFSFDYSDVDYIRNSNPNDLEDMYWNYENNGQILLPITVDSQELDGYTINKSYDAVSVNLRKIYTVKILDDNDTIYTFPANVKTPTVGGKTYDYWPFIAETAETIFNGFAINRPGFTLTYKTDGNAVTALAEQNVILTPEWSISDINMNLSTGKTDNAFVYGDNITISSNYTLETGADFSVAYTWKNGIVIGSAKDLNLNNIYPASGGTYTLSLKFSSPTTSLTRTFENQITISVGPKELTVNWNVPASLIYDGKNKLTDNQITATLNGLINSDAPAITLSSVGGTNLINIGDYTVKCSIPTDFSTKYTIKEPTKSVTIEKKSATLIWNSTNSFVYNGQEQAVGISTIDGAVSSEISSLISQITYNAKETNVGSYTRTANVSALTNYNIATTSCSKTYSITKRPITITVNNQSKTYDGKTFTAYSVDIDNLATTDAKTDVVSDYTGNAINAINAGGYEIGIETNGKKATNYQITINKGTLTIDKKEATLVWNTPSFTYNGKTQYPTVKSISGAISGEESTLLSKITYSGGAVNAGNGYTATANVSALANYNVKSVSLSTTYSIAKKALTIQVDNQSKTYDGTAFTAFTYSAYGLASGDSKEDVVSSITYTGAAVTAVDYGTYTISANPTYGAKAGNYSITLKDGELTINKKALTVTPGITSKTYDGTAYSGWTYTVSGLASTDTESQVLSSVSFDGNAVGAVNAGSYTLALSVTNGTKANNYSITLHKVNFTINKKALTITVGNMNKTYDGVTVTEWNYSIDGLATGDNKEDVVSGYVGTFADAGSYSLSVVTNGTKANNYNISITKGTLTIAKKDITLNWGNTTFTYDGQYHIPMVASISGVVASEEELVLAQLNYSDGGNKNVGNYTATVTLLNNNNYTVTNPTISYQIVKGAE